MDSDVDVGIELEIGLLRSQVGAPAIGAAAYGVEVEGIGASMPGVRGSARQLHLRFPWASPEDLGALEGAIVFALREL